MIYDVIISDQAEKDLREIYSYIAFELQAPENASGQIDRLEEQIYSLEKMPYRFPDYKKEPWRSRGLRFVPVDNFIVYYIPDEEKAEVSIIRVMYVGRDRDRQLEDFTTIG